MGKALINGKPTYIYYRCKTCNRLLTDSLIKTGVCLGHEMIFATTCTFFEWLKVKLGVIK